MRVAIVGPGGLPEPRQIPNHEASPVPEVALGIVPLSAVETPAMCPNPGDCCGFCSFGSVKCPPIQAPKSCCSGLPALGGSLDFWKRFTFAAGEPYPYDATA